MFVIGMGEVGRRLAGAITRSGNAVRPVTRDEGWTAALDVDDRAPRIVAVREDDLGAVLERFPSTLRGRLVLVQNGFLEVVHGDLGPVTRGLIWFTSKGDFFRELAPSPFHGPLAERVAAALSAGGLAVEPPGPAPVFLRAMILKGLWNAVVGLPLAVHGVELGRYLTDHRDELDALVAEGARAASAHYGVEVGATAAVSTILETTGPLAKVRGGAKALAWRNGAIARMGRRHGIATPVNDRLLRAAGYDPES